MNKHKDFPSEAVVNNLKEIVNKAPNTYAAYVAGLTLKVIEEAKKQ